VKCVIDCSKITNALDLAYRTIDVCNCRIGSWSIVNKNCGARRLLEEDRNLRIL
jgi:hypothetical protein